jgi:hypothetical protein
MTQDPEERPIRGLADLEHEVSPQFVSMVRQKIQRRATVSQFANFSWSLPRMILMEFLSLVVHVLAVADGRKGKAQ